LNPWRVALESCISRQFGHLFNSYAQAFNKNHNRHGSLFAPNFKRKAIDSDDYLRKVIHYIHHNPVKPRLVKDIEMWRFSSYKAIISKQKTILKRNEVIGLFDTLDNFIYCHQYPPTLTGIDFN